MRAIKIDPVARTITEIELVQNPNETLQEHTTSSVATLLSLFSLTGASSWRLTKKAS